MPLFDDSAVLFDDPDVLFDAAIINPPPPPVDPTDPPDPETPPPNLGPWQVGINGLTIGGDPFLWKNGPEVFGWGDVRSSDEPRAGAHGSISLDPDLLDTKSLIFEFLVNTYAEQDALARWEQLATAWRPTLEPIPLDLTTPRRRYRIYGRPRRIQPTIQDVRDGYLEVVALFEATDPIYYGLPEKTAVATMGAGEGGLTFPLTFPLRFGGSGGGAANLTNDGNATTERLVVTITAEAGAALVDPRLVLGTTGDALDFDFSLEPGQSLVCDMAEQIVLLDGVIRNDLLRYPQTRWWALPPGSHPVVLSGGGVGRYTARWQSAWIV